MRIDLKKRRFVLSLLVAGLLVGDWVPLRAGDSPTDEDRRAAAVALNYSRAALYRIRKHPCARVMVEEREKILNHLNLNGITDEEVMKLYAGVLDEISQVQMAERERESIQESYIRNLHRDLGLGAFTIAAEMATTQYFSAVKTGASSWWDQRNKTITKDQDQWHVDKKLMTSVVDKSTLFMDTSWKLARSKKIPDRWLVRNDDLEKLDAAWRENNPTSRLRMLKRLESFNECYPPYWYYVARTEQALGQFVAASSTYEKLASLSDGHFRKDEMLATGLANRAYIQSYLEQPGAAETAAKALTYSSDAWEANLICAAVLQKFGRNQDAEEAILRNIDDKLERTQSRVALLGLYYHTDNRPELAARLTDPEWVHDLPIPQLLLCAAKLSPATPATVISQIQATLQGSPRLNFGRDDFVIAASPAWELQNATVTMQLGDKTFTNPRISTFGSEPLLVNFDGITKFGSRTTAPVDEREIAITIKYPNRGPVRLTMKVSDVTPPAMGLGLGMTGRPQTVYRVTTLEQNDLRLSLRTVPTVESSEIGAPSQLEDDDSEDIHVKSRPRTGTR